MTWTNKLSAKNVYDVLPTPANLQRWKLTEDPSCTLCGKRGTLEHIMSSCHIALGQGRYRWHHDRVLRQLAHWLDIERPKERQETARTSFIPFVKEGEIARPSQKNTGVLGTLKTLKCEWTW